MQRSVVVLPQPEGPSMTSSSPSAISRLTFSQARTLPPAKLLRRFWTVISLPDMMLSLAP